jgi:hypothetical protein
MENLRTLGLVQQIKRQALEGAARNSRGWRIIGALALLWIAVDAA